ncbi:MAG: acyl-CoA dehydrogenase [Chloroflexi bacterium]|nr:acyl-CoA dehydrogenase [Chloroflexota bacterium]
MDYGFNEEQEMLRATARDFLTRACPTAHVRAMEEDPHGYSPALWREMAGLGWLGFPFPAAYGGGEGSFLDLAVLLEEMGRALLPSPYLASVLLAGALLNEAGDAAQKAAHLPALAAGERVLTLAYQEPHPRYAPARCTTYAKRTASGWLLTGTKLFVPYAAEADPLVVIARTSGAIHEPAGLSAFLVPATARGLTIAPLKTLAADRQDEVVLDGVQVGDEAVLGPVGGIWPALERVLARATVAECVGQVGLAKRALEITVNFVKRRVQFGVPIGSFQAVQHRCADMATDVDTAHFLAYEAAWKASENLLTARDVSLTKAWVSDAVQRVVAGAQQLHGGAGFIREVNIQLFFRRAKASAYRFGDADYHRAALAATLF